ncbi:hypothetical protein CKA34_12895 [Rhizobium sp. 11515TR]|nr:hypothetical protein CKA34_12895 [Rhizobium sp. 11515TR]
MRYGQIVFKAIACHLQCALPSIHGVGSAGQLAVAKRRFDLFLQRRSRPADIGTGFSIYSATSATADQQFHVQCNCQDFSLATATCPAPHYECY